MEKQSATMRVGANYVSKHLAPQVNFSIRKIRSDGTIVNMTYRPIETEKSPQDRKKILHFKRI